MTSSHSSDGDSTSSSPRSTRKKRGGDLPPAVLVYHASARSIVFRDQLRRAASQQNLAQLAADAEASEATVDTSLLSTASSPVQVSRKVAMPHLATDDPEHKHVDPMGTIGVIAEEMLQPNKPTVVPSEAGINPLQIAGYMPEAKPLDALELGPNDEFLPFVQSDTTDRSSWTPDEVEIVELLESQHACVKTVKNADWTALIDRFLYAQPHQHHYQSLHGDIAPSDEANFNSFVTSTSLLPPGGKKMRCYGSTSQYTVGLVFALPTFDSDEEEKEAAERTDTWSWPAGYSAKTEFNRDSRGQLINGRKEALLPLSTLRQYNDDYLNKDEYTLANNRKVSGLDQIPYNEVYLRVGGMGRIVNGKDVATGEEYERSFDKGVGLPAALFVRTATFGDLITLFRTRARLIHVLGEKYIKGIPLLLITPKDGIRVMTESLQRQLLKTAAHNLNPFQNSTIAYRTTISNTDETSFQQKVDELLDLDDSIRDMLTPEELARIAGGFGATDESVASILKQVLNRDRRENRKNGCNSQGEDSGKGPGSNTKRESSHLLQDVVNEGLAYSVRSGDYHTSRQLLILYSLVASTPDDEDDLSDLDDDNEDGRADNVTPLKGQQDGKDNEYASDPEACEQKSDKSQRLYKKRSSSMGRIDFQNMKQDSFDMISRKCASERLSTGIPAPPPPPPLDTDRLRSATNSDGLLAVLGAAQVLKAMQDGSAKVRVQEAISAVEEWVNYGEQSMAFRISSWYGTYFYKPRILP